MITISEERYFDKKKLQALLKWYMQEVGDAMISVLVVSQEGLLIDILTRDKDKGEEKRFIGAFGTLVETVLKRIPLDFDIGTFGAGTFDTDKFRFTFCEAGEDTVLVTILDPLTMIDNVFPYTYLAADKVARIMEGELPVSPVVPKIIRETELEQIKRKLDYYQKVHTHSPEYIYKLSLVGDGGVGKTSMVQRYVNDYFAEDYKATIGTFISKKEVKFAEMETSVRFVIWDLAGQQQFQRIWPDYLTDSNAGIIVFDITDRKSFENVKKWYDLITRVGRPTLVSILCGNKLDLKDKRVISPEEGKALARELGIFYMETSAKEDIHIDDVFEWIALQILDKNITVERVPLPKQAQIEKSEFLISEAQLKLLNQYFTQQSKYVINKEESQKVLKLLELLKTIEKNKL
ncbi:MAG: GTP-binding protein [Candidatus Thorarchaeota archaeon]